MIYVGIDPGQKGAIAIIGESSTVCSWTKYMGWPTMFSKLKFIAESEEKLVCIEKLWGMPIRGCQGNWSLGGNYETWKALLGILKIPFIEAAPATWQPKILNTSKKKSAETKPLSIAYVNKRYPELDLPSRTKKDIDESSGVSDAICLALYGRMVTANLL